MSIYFDSQWLNPRTPQENGMQMSWEEGGEEGKDVALKTQQILTKIIYYNRLSIWALCIPMTECGSLV